MTLRATSSLLLDSCSEGDSITPCTACASAQLLFWKGNVSSYPTRAFPEGSNTQALAMTYFLHDFNIFSKDHRRLRGQPQYLKGNRGIQLEFGTTDPFYHLGSPKPATEILHLWPQHRDPWVDDKTKSHAASSEKLIINSRSASQNAQVKQNPFENKSPEKDERKWKQHLRTSHHHVLAEHWHCIPAQGG